MTDLTEVYNSYKEMASAIPNWKDADKSELCREFIRLKDLGDPRSDFYFSALMCKYWPKIPRFYKDTALVATQQDCYDWLVDAIMYACDHRRWEDADSNIYNDPKGPDKVINQVMKCNRINFIIACNRNRRKAQINTISKDYLDEELSGNFDFTDVTSSVIQPASEISEEIETSEIFNFLHTKKLYFLMFMYDAILNLACYESGCLDQRKLIRQLKAIDEPYIRLLSHKYKIPEEDLKKCYNKSIKDKTANYLKEQIVNGINTLREFYYKNYI